MANHIHFLGFVPDKLALSYCLHTDTIPVKYTAQNHPNYAAAQHAGPSCLLAARNALP